MKPLLTIIILALTTICFGQKKHHSYVSDREFYEPADLIGYIFRPDTYEVPYQEKRPIRPGDYVFSITRNKLYVEGDTEIKGTYALNNIEPAAYGYKLLLMNAHNPAEQGHLKVVINDQRQVDALIFRRSHEHREIIYFQAKKSANLEQQEAAYFTDTGELIIPSVDDFWGHSFHPFFRKFQSGLNERIYPADSVKINFVRQKVTAPQLFSESGQPIAQTVSMDDAFVSKGKKAKKVAYEEFVELRSYVTYDTGFRDVKVWKYPINKIQQQAEKTGINGERQLYYKIDIKKAEPLYVYVSEDRAIQAIDIEGIIYSPRGK